MKFLCDQCKAKYQISDDKVAGKTVRMKCRKCGHMIEVRAAVTETSVASGTPSEPPPAALTGGAGPSAPPRATPPKPSALPKSSLATSLSSAKPSPPRPLSQRPDAGLAGAFNKQIQKEEDPGLIESATTDEWYAAINGVPVGPIRIAELRRKAALGAVTDDSLVWQEGMEEWRPVKAIPELQKIMQEAATSGRVSSLATPEPPPARSVPPAPQAPSMRPQKPTGPPRPAPPARSNVVPITSRLATAEKLEEAPPPPAKAQPGSGPPEGPTSERLSLAPDPFAIGAPPPTTAAPAASAMASLAAPAPAASAAAAAAAPIVIQQKGPPPVIAIGVILALMAFGGVAAYAIFFKPPPAPQVQVQKEIQYVPVPASATAPADSAAAAAPPSTQTKAPSRASGPKTTTAAAPTASVDVRDLLRNTPSGPTAPTLDFHGGGTGPSVGGGGPASGGGALTEDQITSVLNMHKLAIRRTCLEKSNSGVANPKVTVHVKVAGDGSVSSAISEGNDPTTGKCLENEIAKWRFPSGPGAFDAPFSIVRQ